ncbi:hypothetical protein FACS189435_1700 [Bacteroidia bacterium]|nr:hypothetical protein FACS189435_1700 [Bacteroidia bacterium]
MLKVTRLKIADVAMTGSWEHALAKIGEGKMDAAVFRRSIGIYASQITTELLDIAFERQDDRPGCGCPKCKNGYETLMGVSTPALLMTVNF